MAKGSKCVAVPSGRSGYESVSVRPIDNGYIVSRSTDRGYSETYSPTKPKIELPSPPKASAPKKASPTPFTKAAKAFGKR